MKPFHSVLKLCEPFSLSGKFEHIDDAYLLSPLSMFDISQVVSYAEFFKCSHAPFY